MEEKKKTIQMKKTIATLLVTLGLSVMAYCAMSFLSFCVMANSDELQVDLTDWLEGKDYRESDTLAGHMDYDIRQVIRYMGLRQMLEKDGVLYKEGPALVIQQQDGTVITYTIEDLIRLGAQDGIYVYETGVAGAESEAAIYYDEAAIYYEVHDVVRPSGEAKEQIRVVWSLTNQEDASVDLSADVWTERWSRAEAAANRARTQYAYDQETMVSMSNRSLWSEVHSFLINYVQKYYDYKQEWSQANSLGYQIRLIQGEDSYSYSDAMTLETGSSAEALSSELWDMKYFYNSATGRIVSDMPSYLWDSPIHQISNWSYQNYDSFTISFGVDVDALVEERHADAYSREYFHYWNYRNKVFDTAKLLFVFSLVTLAGMIWLIPLCGREDGTEEIRLNLYDRIPTEVGAAGIFCLIFGGCLAVVLTGDMVMWMSYENLAGDVRFWLFTAMGTGYVILVGLILWLGFYGLIRRIKAHTFWKNSLTGMILRWCMKPLRWLGSTVKKTWTAFFEGGNVTWKTLLLFGGFLAVDMFLFVEFAWGYSDAFFWFLLLVLFNGAVGMYLIRKGTERKQLREGVALIAAGDLDHQVSLKKLSGEEKKLGQQINHIGDGLKRAVDESLKNERMKTELITNVSHDIKTPLTSIINYVDLLKRENIQDEKIQGYIQILDQKSQRLKTLTEDLVEASKASSGTLKMTREKIDFVELINQTTGEFSDRFAACNLSLVTDIPEKSSYIMADGRYVWRILENLYRNAEKYSMPGTRVYIEVFEKIGRVFFVMKNVSNAPLNIKADELTERFIRGDVSRTTEGSGLGLSIAKDMTELMNGTFRIYLDGDLFRVTVSFALIPEKKTDLKEIEENIKKRVAQEEKKGQMAAENLAVETDRSADGYRYDHTADPAQPVKEEKKGLPKLKLPKIPMPKVKLPKVSLPVKKDKEAEPEKQDMSETERLPGEEDMDIF